MRLSKRTGVIAGGLALLLGGLVQPVFADYALNMPVGVTDTSREIYDLHMIIFWWCVAIGVVVYGVMFWSIIWHRKSRGVQPAKFHESVKLEIVWTLIPFLILILMAIPATRLLTQAYDTSESELDVQVVGYQWGNPLVELDERGPELSEARQRRVEQLFRRTVAFEVDFFDSAYG
jgi:heme/copper-type cytochrome/quinol oxidase subunit 2